MCTLILCEGDSAKAGIISGLSKDDRNTIDAKVEFVEYLGAEMNVHFTTQSNSFTAKLNRRIDTRVKDSISVVFDVNRGHFFNIGNGNIL